MGLCNAYIYIHNIYLETLEGISKGPLLKVEDLISMSKRLIGN